MYNCNEIKMYILLILVLCFKDLKKSKNFKKTKEKYLNNLEENSLMFEYDEINNIIYETPIVRTISKRNKETQTIDPDKKPKNKNKIPSKKSEEKKSEVIMTEEEAHNEIQKGILLVLYIILRLILEELKKVLKHLKKY